VTDLSEIATTQLTAASTDLRGLEARLLAHRFVVDCAVLARRDERGDVAIVAYVVTTGALSTADARDFASAVGASPLPDVVVRVSSIPLTGSGEVDEVALSALPVIDTDLIAHFRDVLRASAQDADVAIEWNAPMQGTLNVDEIVPRVATGVRATVKAAARPVALRETVLSLSEGPDIIWPFPRARQLSDLLKATVAAHPTHGVTVIEPSGEAFLSYADLQRRAERMLGGLRAMGVRAGDVLIFEIDRNIDFVSALWACFLGGFVAAPISVPVTADPTNAAATKLRNAWELLGRPVVVTTETVSDTLESMRSALDLSAMRTVLVSGLLRSTGDSAWHDSKPDDLALLLLTSGSTGRPKAVTQTHDALVTYVTGVSQRHGFTANDVSLNWFPLDHVGGVVMFHMRDLAIGCPQIHVTTNYVLQDVLRWLDLIERFRVTITWAPNFAYALVNDRASEVATRSWDLSSLWFILNAGEAIAASTTRRFMRLLAMHGLPATAMRPSWGMSETCSAQTFAEPFLVENTSDTDEFVVVGTPNPAMYVRIVNAENQLVPEGMEGHLEVNGPCITKGYLNNPEVNAGAYSPDGWFRTGDLGRLVNGGLTITGREKGEIIVNGVNYPAHEVEAAAESVSGVTASFAAAFAVRATGDATDSLAIAFHTAYVGDVALSDLVKRVRQGTLDRVGVAPRYLLLVEQSEIPKTAIGKIQRAALTKRFAEGGFAAAVQRSEQLTKRAETIPDWFFHPTWRKRVSRADAPVDSSTTMIIVDDINGVSEALTEVARGAGAAVVMSSIASLADEVSRVASDSRLIVVVAGASGRVVDEGSDAPGAAMTAARRVRDIAAAIARSRAPSAHTELVAYDIGARAVVAADKVAIGRGATIGLLRTISSEHPEIAVRHVDFENGDATSHATVLLAEVADRRDESEVAYRVGARWVRRLERHAFAAPTSSSGRVLGRTDGFYLITGGLGGVGVEVAKQVLRTTDARVLLVGRQPLTAGDGRTATLASLQALGEVRYAAADVADYAALEHVVNDASRTWDRPLAVALHLAGTFAPAVLDATSDAMFAEALRAKVTGGWNVHRVVLTQPAAVFVAFSSVNGEFGGYTASSYAVANAFLDRLVDLHIRELDRAAYSLGWTLWDGIGMSRELAFKDSAGRRGYHAIAAAQGVTSFVATVSGTPGHVLVGLDSTNPAVRRSVDDTPRGDRLVVRLNAVEKCAVAMPAHDRFAVAVPTSVQQVVAQTSGVTANAFGSAIEQKIGGVWREVLSTSAIGPNENFFEAGGTSLLAASASRKLQEALGRSVAMTDLYRFPTIRLLAQYYAGDETQDRSELDDSEARGKARRANRTARRGSA
jgi:acyl-CoA synthetase (AMP-forming)/AMP-acid ligase II